MPGSRLVKRMGAPFRRLRLREFPPAELKAIESELRQAERTLGTFEKKLRVVERGRSDYLATKRQIEVWSQKVADLRENMKKFQELMDK